MMIILSGDKDRMHCINFIQVWLFTKLVCRLYTRKKNCVLISTIWVWKCVIS